MPFMVLLARTAGLRLLGLLLFFVPAFKFFSTASRADFFKAARCGDGKWYPQNHW